MTDNSRRVSELDQQPVLADQDRLLICLANGAVRTANVSTALANADVTIGKLILANANSTVDSRQQLDRGGSGSHLDRWHVHLRCH